MKTYKVIIADDEPKVSQLIMHLIDWDNLNLEHVATAHDGHIALELIKKHNPEIVITDIRMPGCDGIELIKRAKEFNPDIDFIVVSGYQHFDYAYNAIKYGVKDYFLKPLKKNDINVTLTKMVNNYAEKSMKEFYHQEDVARLKRDLIESIYYDTLTVSIQEKSLNQINLDYGLSFTEGFYQALIIKPDFDYQYDLNGAMKIILDKISNIARQILKTLCSEIISVTLEDRIFVIINYKEDNKKQIRRAFNYIIDESHLFRDVIKNLMISIGLGKTCIEFGMIVQSTYQAKEAIVDRIVFGAGKINQFNDELHSKHLPDSIIYLNKRKKLIKMVEILDINGVTMWIAETQSEIQNLSGVT